MFAGFPFFVEQEMGGILVILMQIVLNATFFAPRDRDQFFQFRFDQIDRIGMCLDVGNNGDL